MKARYANYAAALLALLLLLTSCASGDSAATERETFSETGTENLMETVTNRKSG